MQISKAESSLQRIPFLRILFMYILLFDPPLTQDTTQAPLGGAEK